MTLRIAVVDAVLNEAVDQVHDQATQAGISLVAAGQDLDLRGANAVVVSHSSLTGAVLERGRPTLRHLQLLGRLFDHVDWRAARAMGLTIGHQPRKGAWTVAELVVTFILALSKRLLEADEATRTGAYRRLGIEPRPTSQRVHAFQWMKLPLREICGATIGFVGMGEIGAEAALRLQPFGARLIYFKRTPLSPEAEHYLQAYYAPLHDVLAEAGYVVVAVPQTAETEGLIGRAAIETMREDAYLINVARGAVVDEDALVDALLRRRIRGAALDVFRQEPLPGDHPLTKLDNVVLTPHIGGGTGVTRAAELWGAVERARQALATGEIAYPLAGGTL